MEQTVVKQLIESFGSALQVVEGVEMMCARDLQDLLGYNEWRNFTQVIDKAKVACANAKNKTADHFVDVNKMVDLGSGAKREVDDILLTRYACYLVAQNSDPRKQPVAFAMNYFAVQTRRQELLEQRIHDWERIQAREKLTEQEKQLSLLIYERGVDEQGFGRIRSKGDQALFGGHTTAEMKNKLQVPGNRPLADFLPTITIKAKDFAMEITNFNVQKANMQGEESISKEHVKNNHGVRDLLGKRGIKPETLPPAEDVKKVDRRLKAEEKKLVGKQALLKNKPATSGS